MRHDNELEEITYDELVQAKQSIPSDVWNTHQDYTIQVGMKEIIFRIEGRHEWFCNNPIDGATVPKKQSYPELY